MGITSGEPAKNGWTAELLDSVLWQLNQFHGREPYVAQAFFDWAFEWWEVKIFHREDRSKYVMLKIPGEYETTKPVLNFDGIVSAAKSVLRGERGPEIDLRHYRKTGIGPTGFTSAPRPHFPEVGEVIEGNDGQRVRVISVDLDTGHMTVGPVELTADLEQRRLRQRLEVEEAEEAEALEIMREALRRRA